MMNTYSRYFQSYVFPVLDRLNRTKISKVLRVLDDSEWHTLGELRDLQNEKLKSLMEFTRDSVPYYTRFWEKASHECSAESEYPLLSGIPLVKKEDLRKVEGQFPVAGYRGRVIRSKTSGSTGQPMTFVRSLDQESWFWALRFRIWRWAGYDIGDPHLTINLNPRKALKKRLQDCLFRCCYLNYNADNLDSQYIIECLRSREISHLNGFSSSLFVLARYMNRQGIYNPGVSTITATGDTLFPHYRELIEKQFGVRVIDYYGAGGEGMHLASQCEHRKGYHIHMENSIVEIIADNRPARPGELGRIVVTQLDNYAMPLIRYDIGDTAIAGNGELCSCGRAHTTLQSIQGRVYDIVYAPNGSALLPHFFVVFFKNLQEISQYQIVQEEEDRVLVKLVAGPQCARRRCEEELKEEIKKRTEASLKTEFRWVSHIPLSGAGKRRVVVSLLGHQTLDRLPAKDSNSTQS